MEVKNAELAVVADDLDNILASSLAVDDWVDLSTLRVTAQHPPFDRTDLEIPLPPPPPPAYPSEPIYLEPAAPHGMSGMFGGKKKHEAAVETSKAQHAENVKSWQIYCAQVNEHHAEQVREHHAAETQRLANLDAARAEYRHACQGREDAAAKQNAQLDRLINDLGFDVESAIQEYVGIVLSNSIYPTHFPISYEHEFSLATRELRLQVHVPEPASVSTIKEYRYIRAKDDITATQLPLKAVKDRYAQAIWQVAVRSLHEVFEGDRVGRIHAISLTVGCETVNAGTGLPETVPLVAAAVTRDEFVQFDLANVVPAATLTHLQATMSKSPYDLTPADTSRGVRKRTNS